MADYSNLGLDPAWAVPYTAGNTPASQTWSGSGSAPAWWGSAVGTETMPSADGAWGDKLTKALGDLTKGQQAAQQASGSGAPAVGSMVGAQSGTGGGRAPSLDALVQLLMQRYQALYPGGGSSKGLLGV